VAESGQRAFTVNGAGLGQRFPTRRPSNVQDGYEALIANLD
jgi:hypothetical protein